MTIRKIAHVVYDAFEPIGSGASMTLSFILWSVAVALLIPFFVRGFRWRGLAAFAAMTRELVWCALGAMRSSGNPTAI